MHIVMMLASGNAQMTGGVPSATLLRASVYRKLGHEVTILIAGHPDFETQFEVQGFPIIPVRPRDFKLRPTWEKIWTHPFLPAAQKKVLVNLHQSNPIGMIEIQDGQCILACKKFAKKHGIPVLYTIHGTAFGKQAIPKASLRYWKWAEKKAATEANISIPLSFHLKSYHDDRWDTTQHAYFVIHNPIPADVLIETAKPVNDPYFLAMGRMEGEKRFHLAIEAFAKIAHRTSHRLYLVGDGRLRNELIELAKSKGLADRIEFSDGAIRDRKKIIEIVQRASVVLLPSQDEGCPLTLLEAIASKVPVVATSQKFNVEILPSDYSYLFEKDDLETFSEMMIAASEQPRAAAAERYAGCDVLHDFAAYEARIERLLELVQERQFTPHIVMNALVALEEEILNQRTQEPLPMRHIQLSNAG